MYINGQEFSSGEPLADLFFWQTDYFDERAPISTRRAVDFHPPMPPASLREGRQLKNPDYDDVHTRTPPSTLFH